MKRFSFIHTLTHSNFLPTANAVPMPRVFNFSYFFFERASSMDRQFDSGY